MILSPIRSYAVWGLMLCCCATKANAETEAERSSSKTAVVDFNRDIRPLLSDKCFHCHGPDANHREADLRLDVESDAHALAITPGNLEASEAFVRITSDDEDLLMPPPDSGKSLSREDIETIRQWIEQGAKYDEHWSFTPPVRPEPPETKALVAHKNWPINPIDQFVLTRMHSEGLAPSPKASKTRLIRRVTLDLTGLPPTIDEVDAFLKDDSDDAYEKVVDRLLSSEAYGERMAVRWLDAARYADTMGYQADWERYQWRWRSWVIDAYNRNLPFDEFTIEQLAGDLLPAPSTEQLIATGFNRNHRINDEGGIIPEEYLVEYIVDRVETTSATWLGLTMGCARCHDHKFDPFSQKDFYRLFAFFNSVPEQGKQGRKGYADPYMRVAVRGKQADYDSIKAQVNEAQKDLDTQLASLKDEQEAWVANQKRELAKTGEHWTVTNLESIDADGVTFRKQKDKSHLATKVIHDRPTYKIKLSTESDKPVTGLRLEALTHKSLSDGKLSPGQGNFYLTDFTVFIGEGENTRQIAIQSADADYHQSGFPVAHAIDDDPATAWAVDGHDRKENRTAAFVFAEPADVTDETLTLQLRFDSPHAKRIIGRLRLAFSTVETPLLDPNNGLPTNVAKAIRKPPKRRSPTDVNAIREHFGSQAPQLDRQRERLREVRSELKAFEDAWTTYVMVMQQMPKPRPTHILNRGVYDQPGDEVFAGVPTTVLGDLPSDSNGDRLGLARWLVSGKHPLTARVAVNRYWAMLFGRGIVPTLEDFGLQGEYPSHPQLLDWLATEYPRIGWDTKEMLKMMVMSATYQQSSNVTPEMTQRDPKNILLARSSRLRLPAEMIRDSALFASGLLIDQIGGASVKPYQPAGLWSELSFASKSRTTDFYVQAKGDGLYRRSLYTFWKRSVPPPTMATFDAPSRETCVLERSRTNTPLQSLALMNDVTYLEASRVLAARAIKNAGKEVGEQIQYAFRSLLARHADDKELQIVLSGYTRRKAYFAKHVEDARDLIQHGDAPPETDIDEVTLASLTTCVMTIMNLDESINRE